MRKESRLLDMEELGKRHPALNNKYRMQWLVRTRQIPIVRIGRRIFFDEKEIDLYIQKNSIPAMEGNIKNG